MDTWIKVNNFLSNWFNYGSTLQKSFSIWQVGTRLENQPFSPLFVRGQSPVEHICAPETLTFWCLSKTPPGGLYGEENDNEETR